MMYSEFLSISKVSETEVTYEQYSRDIEPCYMFMPGGLDKEAFIKWWSTNKETVAWISQLIKQKEALKKDIAGMQTQQTELENRIYAQDKVAKAMELEIEEKKKELEEREEYWKEQMMQERTTANEVIYELKVRSVFEPEALTRDMKVDLFDEYETVKAWAVKKGIIKN